jgi:hypothetical protein
MKRGVRRIPPTLGALAVMLTTGSACLSPDAAAPTAGAEDFRLDSARPLVVVPGEGDAGFARVAWAGQLSSGALVVADQPLGEVHVVDPTVNRHAVVLERGQGPGEVEAVVDAHVFGSDSILVAEPSGLLLLDSRGAFVRRIAFPAEAFGARIVGVIGDAVIVSNRVPPVLEDGLKPNPIRIFAVSLTAGTLRSHFIHEDLQVYYRFRPGQPPFLGIPPFHARSVAAVSDSSLFSGIGDRPYLYERAMDGAVQDSFAVAMTPRPLTSGEIAGAKAARIARADAGDDPLRRRNWERLFDDVSFPDHHPFFDELLAGSDGLLWLREPPMAEGDTAVWWGHTRVGELARRLIVPPNLELFQITADRVVAVALDEFDVPRVLVLALEPIDPAGG